MNIAIIGAGIIGVCTAYELASDGHAVTVFERHASVAEEASFANAGLLSPAWIDTAVNPPGRVIFPTGALKGISRKHASAESTPETRLALLQRLALYSRRRTREISNELAYQFDRRDGILLLMRNTKNLAEAAPRLEMARALDIPFHEISASEARQIEPALHSATSLASAVYFPQDEVANCRQFAVILRDAAEQLGASFCFHSEVTHVATANHGHSSLLRLANETSDRHFDAIVLCSGASSTTMLKPLGIRVRQHIQHGYSITAQISEAADAPRSAVIDVYQGVTIARLGQRIRVSGPMEPGSGPTGVSERAIQTIYKTLADWYPRSALLSKGVQVWKGICSHFPDALPNIGTSSQPGIWLNLGHGSAGWTLASGSARVLADQMSGKSAHWAAQDSEEEPPDTQ